MQISLRSYLLWTIGRLEVGQLVRRCLLRRIDTTWSHCTLGLNRNALPFTSLGSSDHASPVKVTVTINFLERRNNARVLHLLSNRVRQRLWQITILMQVSLTGPILSVRIFGWLVIPALVKVRHVCLYCRWYPCRGTLNCVLIEHYLLYGHFCFSFCFSCLICVEICSLIFSELVDW